jgi:hypothetical protein
MDLNEIKTIEDIDILLLPKFNEYINKENKNPSFVFVSPKFLAHAYMLLCKEYVKNQDIGVFKYRNCIYMKNEDLLNTEHFFV